jgi:hypothetical protein
MTTPFPFVAGTVLTAAKLNDITNLPINDQTASYTLVVGDAGKRVVMNVASANTVTVDDDIFGVGDTIFIANKGAGATTVTAGSGVTINTAGSLVIAQHGGGTLVATSASVFTFFSGAAATVAADFLIIGGGGGGQTFGGGGAGGYRNSVTGESQGGLGTLDPQLSLATGVVFTVTVGAGGAVAINGSTSLIRGTGLPAVIGLGGGNGGDPGKKGNTGGSGGGGGGNSANNQGGAGEVNQGFAGGNGFNGSFGSGGGGGAGAVGANATSTTGGAGGAGLSSSIDGSATTRGGGGGGFSEGVGGGGAGGTGGGGSGITPSAGTANTGGGGGRNQAGGSGVVIIRTLDSVPDASTLTSGTKTTPTGFKVYTFNASGTIGWS